jgi:hypothetical protein
MQYFEAGIAGVVPTAATAGGKSYTSYINHEPEVGAVVGIAAYPVFLPSLGFDWKYEGFILKERSLELAA